MPYEKILGNDHAKQYLKHMTDNGRVGNSLLFAGPDGVGKGLIALEFARELLCRDDVVGSHRIKVDAGNHPDLHVYKPEGKLGMHSIDTLRRFSEEVYLYPYEARKKIFIIHDADRMAPAAANALLKTFEEPAEDAIIILISSHPEALLGTILSRCRKIHFRPVPELDIQSILQERGLEPAQAKLLSRLSAGSISKALQWASQGLDPKRDQLLDLLSQGRVASYVHVVQTVKGLSDSIDALKKEIETELRAQLMAVYPDPKGITALQRQLIEKEVEGAISTRVQEEVGALLDHVATWYRDIHLLKSGTDPEWVIHADRLDALKEMAKRDHVHCLSGVEKAIEEAQLSLARSSPLSACLESLFLKLDVV